MPVKTTKKLIRKPAKLFKFNKAKNKSAEKISRLTLRLQAEILIIFIMIIAGGIIFYNYYLNQIASAFVTKGANDILYASDWNELEPSNSVVKVLADNVPYQNNGKHKLIVVAFGNAVAGLSDVSGYIGSATPNLLVASDTGTAERRSITFIVPVGWWYKVNIGGGSLSAEAWEI